MLGTQDWCGDKGNLDAHKDDAGAIQTCEAKRCLKTITGKIKYDLIFRMLAL